MFPWDDGILVRATLYDPATGTSIVSGGNLSTALRSEGTSGGALPSHIVQVGGKGEADNFLHPLMLDDDSNLHVTARTGLPDPSNSVTGQALNIGETWLGAWSDAEEYPFIMVSIKSDQASAHDGWSLQFSADGVNVGCEYKMTYDGTQVGVGRSLTIVRRGRYFRHKFINGAVAATFNALTILSKAGAVGEMVVIDNPVLGHYSGVLTKSVIAGKTTAGGTSYVDVKVNPSGALAVEATQGTSPWVVSGSVTSSYDQYYLSAFGELRTSRPYVLVDLISKYGRNTELTSTSLTGAGAVADVTSQSAFRLSVTNANGDAARVRTNEWFRYQTGRGHRTTLTLYCSDAGQANQVRNWGIFDSSDGVGFRLSGTTLQVFRRTSTGESGGSIGSPYEEVVSKANWNLAPVACDVTKGNIYEIQFQWLGVGVVHFFINGTEVHRMIHPNTLAFPYMKSASLPLTWEVINTGASTAASMTVICGNVTSENGEDPPLISHSHISNTITTTVATETPVMAIRLKQLLNGVDNRTMVLPAVVSVDNQTSVANASAVIYVRYNPTLTNATFANDHGSDSAVEIDTAATAVSGGELVARFVVPISDGREIDLSKYFKRNAKKLLRKAYSGVSDILSISVQRQQASNVSVVASILWNEIL